MKALKRSRVSAELGQLVQDFHQRSKHAVEDGLEEALARGILLGYRRGERVSTKLSYAAVIFEVLPGSRAALPTMPDDVRVTLLCEGGAQYLVASGSIDKLEGLIEEFDVAFRRTYRFPYRL